VVSVVTQDVALSNGHASHASERTSNSTELFGKSNRRPNVSSKHIGESHERSRLLLEARVQHVSNGIEKCETVGSRS
jgi:hypothetical protein